jgi:type II secretory pathway component PulC
VDKDSIYEFVIHVVFLSILNFIYLMSLNLRNKRQIIKKKDERKRSNNNKNNLELILTRGALR